MDKDPAQDSLFDVELTPSAEEVPGVSLEALGEQMRLQRQEALAAHSSTQLALEDAQGKAIDLPIQENSEVAKKQQSPRKGGAFGGALKRRLEQAGPPEEVSFTERDLSALMPLTIFRELFTSEGDQVYGGVVFTPEEFSAITFSPQRLAQRIGSKVLKGTVGRPASDRLARKDEVIHEALVRQKGQVDACLANLLVDKEVFEDLAKEMRSPGYAHMGQEDMDALVAHTEGVFVSMFEAILTNRGVGTERVKNLTAAMYSLLENKNYKQAFNYRRHLNNIGLDWTKAKAVRLTEVGERVQNELDGRFG